MKKSKKLDSEDKTYTPIWQRIKSNFVIDGSSTAVSCPPDNIARLKKAMAKEKDLDTSWAGKRYHKLVSKPLMLGGEQVGLEFKLVQYRERELATTALLKT